MFQWTRVFNFCVLCAILNNCPAANRKRTPNNHQTPWSNGPLGTLEQSLSSRLQLPVSFSPREEILAAVSAVRTIHSICLFHLRLESIVCPSPRSGRGCMGSPMLFGICPTTRQLMGEGRKIGLRFWRSKLLSPLGQPYTDISFLIE